MTLNEMEILGQGFPWLSNRVVAFSHAQWKPGTWTHDARWLSPVKALKPPATSSVNRSQSGSPGDNCFKNCTFPSSWFEMSILLKRRENPGNSFLFSHLQGAQRERLQGQRWHALSPKQCPNVEEYITPSFFLTWHSFLQSEPRVSLALDTSLVCSWDFSSRKEASLLKSERAFYSLTREAAFLLSLATLSQI